MGLSSGQIIKILQLRNVGRKTAFKICELSSNFSIKDDKDLSDFLSDIANNHSIAKLPIFSKNEMIEAFEEGDYVIQKSLNSNIKYVSFFETDFPSRLKNEPDPPILINFIGDIELLSSLRSIAIIGTREPNKSGESAAYYFGKKFGSIGFNVVSGLATGCDSFAHKGCLDSKGKTTAILAHGLHTIYPKENRSLSQDIVENGGLLISEYLYGVSALPNYFVERDRLQAGLADATIVIQTDIKGGTMHAVNATLKSSKPLAAVQYKLDSQFTKTRGNDVLIKEGKAFALSTSSLDLFIDKLEQKYASHIKSNDELSNKSISSSLKSEIISKKKSKRNLSDEPTLF